jgi:hypothetical protein
MEINISKYGNSNKDEPAKVIEMHLKHFQSEFTIEITDKFSQIDIEFIKQLRYIADLCERQNHLTMNKKNDTSTNI